MAASLGTGIFALMGGLEIILDFQQSDVLLGIIGGAIVLAFIISAVSGLQKGISILSDWNIKAFFLLTFILFVGGSTF